MSTLDPADLKQQVIELAQQDQAFCQEMIDVLTSLQQPAAQEQILGTSKATPGAQESKEDNGDPDDLTIGHGKMSPLNPADLKEQVIELAQQDQAFCQEVIDALTKVQRREDQEQALGARRTNAPAAQASAEDEDDPDDLTIGHGKM